jgi:cytochrome c
MRLLHHVLRLTFAAILLVSVADAAERATLDEAKALADKAADHLAKAGIEKSIADFNDPAAGFIDRELFVNVIGPDHRLLSAYGVPVLVGRDTTTFKDADGKEFDNDIVALAKSQGSGWVSYRMTNPVTKKTEKKSSWVRQVGDYVVFVGAFPL